MFIENKAITHKNLTWTLRCPKKADAEKLSTLRVKIDGETEYLDREAGENLLTKDDFEKIIYEDNTSNTSLFLLAEVKKITLTVVGSNEKAIQMYKQFGFTIEGLLINDRIHKDGRYHNTVIMGRFSNN